MLVFVKTCLDVVSVFIYSDFTSTLQRDFYAEVMRTIAIFRLIRFPSHHYTPGLNHEEQEEMRRRLQCAFVLAEHEGGGRRSSQKIKTENLDENQIIRTKDVYPPEIACRMWDIFGAEAKTLGYTLPNGIAEEECGNI